jgi:hypothetical protein
MAGRRKLGQKDPRHHKPGGGVLRPPHPSSIYDGIFTGFERARSLNIDVDQIGWCQCASIGIPNSGDMHDAWFVQPIRVPSSYIRLAHLAVLSREHVGSVLLEFERQRRVDGICD